MARLPERHLIDPSSRLDLRASWRARVPSIVFFLGGGTLLAAYKAHGGELFIAVMVMVLATAFAIHEMLKDSSHGLTLSPDALVHLGPWGRVVIPWAQVESIEPAQGMGGATIGFEYRCPAVDLPAPDAPGSRLTTPRIGGMSFDEAKRRMSPPFVVAVKIGLPRGDGERLLEVAAAYHAAWHKASGNGATGAAPAATVTPTPTSEAIAGLASVGDRANRWFIVAAVVLIGLMALIAAAFAVVSALAD